jgi:hypothetical protein
MQDFVMANGIFLLHLSQLISIPSLLRHWDVGFPVVVSHPNWAQ